MYIFDKFVDRNNARNITERDRIKYIFYLLFFLFLLLSSKLIYVSLKNSENTISIQKIDSQQNHKRNAILDRNGTIIASDANFINFSLNRELVVNPRDTVEKISKIIPNINKEKLYNKLIDVKNKAKYILVKRQITPKQAEEIRNSKIVGFEFVNTYGRIYPHKNLFSHVVGYTNYEKNGVDGIEYQYNEYLKNNKNPPLKLTLDARIQSVLRQELDSAMKKYKSESAIGIISEIKTGNILAMVVLPDFNPNNMFNINQETLFNKATYGVYEMGSIFKIFTIACALDMGIIQEDQKFDITQIIKYGNYEIKQSSYTKNYLTPEEILIHSSNVGAGLIGIEIGNQRFREFLNSLGMFDKIPANYPSLAHPIIPNDWTEISTVTISYGYGISISPLHIVMGVGGIVNNGIIKIPRFTTLDNFQDKKIIQSNTSKIINVYLRNVVRYGTGWRANTLGYAVGGKTGSARLVKEGKYQQDNILANFVGAFPMNDPHFLIYIMIASPTKSDKKDDISAGTISAPIFNKVVERIAPILNVIPYINRNEYEEETNSSDYINITNNQ